MSVTRNAHQLPTEHLPAVVHAVEPAWKDVEIMTLDDVDSNNLPKGRPMRILVTIHSINSAYSNTIKNGLGLWVFYILKKYFRTRNIPVKLFMKSIVLGRNGWFQRWEKKTDVEDLIQFIDKNDIDVLIPSDVTDTQFVSRHYAELAPHVKCAVTSNVDVYERLEDKWETYTFCRQNNLRKLAKIFLDAAACFVRIKFVFSYF